MKKILFFLSAIMITASLATSCKKENSDTKTPVIETPRTQVPDALVGNWQIGDFDMKGFWSYNGNHQPSAGTDAVAYRISKDGSAEQFIYYDFADGTDRQVLAYRKGTVTYEAASGSWKFCSSEGNFRAFVKGKKTEGIFEAVDLFPNYTPLYTNCFFEDQSGYTFLVCTNSRNEQLGFKKVN